MIAGAALDLVLCLAVVGAGLAAVAGPGIFAGAVAFIVYGLLLSLVWVRLDAVDVALAEAAIGAGLTGFLLLGVIARIRPEGEPEGGAEAPAGVGTRLAAALVAIAGAGGLLLALSTLPAGPPPGLSAEVAERQGAMAVGNPVTAVLLGFRAFDTLLETVVLVLALLGVWSLATDADWGARAGLRHRARPDGALAYVGRLMPPIGLLIATYLFWTGSSGPGGAFQAGTVLAGVWLIGVMAAQIDAPAVSDVRVRLAVAGGPLVFLGAGLAGLGAAGAFLGYPPGAAKVVILVIEAVLTVSIAATLGMIVAGPPRRER